MAGDETSHPEKRRAVRDEVGKLTWHGSGAQTVSLVRPADVSDLPSPASGLIGHQRELMRIGTRLPEGTLREPRTVTLHGAGGIGKTALLWQSLLRFAPSFESTLAIGLDPLPSLESVLGRIERFLGLPSPCSNDTKEREALVRNALTSKSTLLGLDNFETLNYALNEKGSDEEKTAKSLHTFFKSLAANGVTLCVTSREVTNLPGETVEDIQGLTNESGGRLFQENVVKQKDEIYIKKTQQVSEMVGGHPLALRLLASAFDDQVGTSLDQYIEDLQSHLPKARDKWTEEDRHESLRASFDFTMNSLVKTDEGKELQIALSRLSVFTAFFFNALAAPILDNGFPVEEKIEETIDRASKILRALWERGLLERTAVSLEDENFYLYRLHPTLDFFAKERLSDSETVKENYWKSMSNWASIAEEQIDKQQTVAQIVVRSLPDLLIAAESKNDNDAALMQLRVSKFLQQFSLYDDSMRLLEKSRDTHQTLNDMEGKGDTLSSMAQIHLLRGSLDEAMKLCQQSLEIYEGLGDLPQKTATTLIGIAQIHVIRGELDKAMKLYQQSLEIFKDLDDQKGVALTLGEMGGIYFRYGDLDKALENFEQKWSITNQLGDLKEKSIAITNIAAIYSIRGDLVGAMKLYVGSLEISEALGDLLGKALTLGHIGVMLLNNRYYAEGLKSSLSALEIFIKLQAKLEIQNIISTLNQVKEAIGDHVFQKLWWEVTGSGQLPEWLSKA